VLLFFNNLIATAAAFLRCLTDLFHQDSIIADLLVDNRQKWDNLAVSGGFSGEI
jgi:hypothetical protein